MHPQALRHLRGDFDSEHLYIGLYNPRWLPKPEKITLEINVEIEKLSLEKKTFTALTAAAICFFATTVARGWYEAGQTRNVARCDAANGEGGDFPFSSRCRWLFAC